MKKLINTPENVVTEALQGMEAAYRDLLKFRYNPHSMRADAPVKDKVALISGGGSGREPMHGGFVGQGMLDADGTGAERSSVQVGRRSAPLRQWAGRHAVDRPEKRSLMTSISSANIEAWLRRCADVFTKHQDELTELDAKIGDADHGVNMARGFSAIPPKLDPLVDRSIGSLFRTSAMTLISKVGGASGPLYGTFFLQAARLANGKTELTLKELCQCFDTGLSGVVKLGKAVVGDKTMVDALTPALAALYPKDEDSLNTALERAASVARAAAEATIPLIARQGRASYLGELSVGHKDPGATSSALLLEALAEAVKPSS